MMEDKYFQEPDRSYGKADKIKLIIAQNQTEFQIVIPFSKEPTWPGHRLVSSTRLLLHRNPLSGLFSNPL